MKRDKNFKMWKSTKVFLANILDKEQRNIIKRMMIDAQIAAMSQPKKEMAAEETAI